LLDSHVVKHLSVHRRLWPVAVVGLRSLDSVEICCNELDNMPNQLRRIPGWLQPRDVLSLGMMNPENPL
jgi:hypothetical protein